MEETHCPECGAVWAEDQTCTDRFHLMGFWELDFNLYEVHHLMVLCYHLQHPSLYSPEGLNWGIQRLVEFVEEGLTPQTVRKRDARALDSGVRQHKIKGTAQSHGAYPHPVRWTMTAADVVTAGIDAYYESVHAWASSVLETLSESANLIRN